MASDEHVHRRGDEVSGRKYTRDTVLVRIVRTNNEEYIGAKSSADNAVSAVIQAGLFFRAKFLGKKGWNVLTRNNCFVFFFLFFVSFFSFNWFEIRFAWMRYKFLSRGEGEEGIGVENSKIENFTKFVQDHFVIQFEAKSLLSRR